MSSQLKTIKKGNVIHITYTKQSPRKKSPVKKSPKKGISLSEFGYTTKITPKPRREALAKAIKKHGKKDVIGMLHRLTSLQSYNPNVVRKLKDDIKFLERK